MPSKKPNMPPRAPISTGLTRGDAPMEVRQRPYAQRTTNHGRASTRPQRTSNNYQHKQRHPGHRTGTNRQLSRELDERLVELQALFDVSKTLNSSLHLKNILDTLLLTPMGKMMVGKGLVLLARGEKRFVIETVKGLQQTHIGREIMIDLHEPSILTLNDEDGGGAWSAFLYKLGLQLVVPIIANYKCLGLMVFGRKQNGLDFTPGELEYLNSLANLAATAVENGMVFQELRDVNRKLDKKIQELNTLFDIGKELNSTFESDKIASVLAYALMGELMVQRCGIFVEDGERLDLQVNKGLLQNPVFENADFLAWLRKLKEPYFVKKSKLDLAPQEPEWSEQLAAAGGVLLIPIISQDVVRGALLLGEKITKGDFVQEEIEFASTLANTAMISLENARLFKVTLEKQRLEEELAIAREIQQRLLPKAAPKLAGYELAAINIPTHQVGGDYFDYFPIDGNRYLLTVADVSGKGIPAAIIMSNLQATLHALMTAEVPIDQIVARINNSVYANTTADKFITCFIAVLDVTNNSLTYVNAGHNHPYLFNAKNSAQEQPTFRLLDKGGLLLGMFPGARYESETVTLQDGDWVVMYTDGVSEAKNSEDEEFSEKRIEATIYSRLAEQNVSAAAMIDAITNEVKRFTSGEMQSDDITLLAIHYNQPNAA